jgi:uncharacterized RDD family membrane protein YckC
MEKELVDVRSLIRRRIGAVLIDHIIITLIAMIPVFIYMDRLQNDSRYYDILTPYALAIFAVCYLIKDLFAGRSIGKRLFGLYVREYDDTDKIPAFYKLVLRNLFIFIWPVEVIIMYADKDKRRLGDMIAKTKVIGYQDENILWNAVFKLFY